MPDTTAVAPMPANPDARARRRRMTRRRARRRASRVAVVVAMVFALANMMTPERTATTVAPSPADVVDRSTGEAIGPAWRPAGEVLKRKVAATPLTPSMAPLVSGAPFAADSREAERTELFSRLNRVFSYARRYNISYELAGKIYDAAVREGIEPELGFRLVRVESVFDVRATSPVGAIGLTQLMPSTARFFEPGVTREQLYDPDLNLQIGFRYLRTLIRQYKGNLRLALLVYNRGPAAVQSALALGEDPANGYERVMLRGYRGRGVLD